MVDYEAFTKVWVKHHSLINESRKMSTEPIKSLDFPKDIELQEIGMCLACYHFGLEGQPSLTTASSAFALLGGESFEIHTIVKQGMLEDAAFGAMGHVIQVYIDALTGRYGFEPPRGLRLVIALFDDEFESPWDSKTLED